MTAPTYIVGRDDIEARRRQGREMGEHDHRVAPCDRLHFHFSQLTRIEPLSRAFIAERMADAVARVRKRGSEEAG